MSFNPEAAGMQMDLFLRVRPEVALFTASKGRVRLKIQDAGNPCVSVTIYADSLDVLDAIADAIYHAKMDASADDMQADAAINA